MKVSARATKGHLIVGGILVALSLITFVISLFTVAKLIPFFIFFFGVWGGVELGRYLEHSLAN